MNLLNKLKTDRERISVLILQIFLVLFLIGVEHAANAVIGVFIIYVFTSPGAIIQAKKALKDWRILAFMTLFILGLLGFIHSDDLKQAWKYSEMRLALILLPVPLYLVKLSGTSFNKLLLTFSLACVFAGILGIGNGIYKLIQTGDSGFLYNDYLVYPVNSQAVYYAIYVNLSIIFLVYLVDSRFFSKNARLLVFLSIAFLLIFSFLLASRLSIIFIYGIGFLYLLFLIVKHKRIKQGVLGVLVFIVLIIGLLSIFPKTFKRFESITNLEYDFKNENPENHFNREITSENWNGMTLRLAIWSCTWDVIKQNMMFGVGTGDYDQKLNEAYNKRAFKYAIDKKYGAHNQYLYVWISFGIVGVIIFLLSMLYPIKIAMVEGNWLYVVFIIMIMFACLTENLLNRYYGIMFFAFFNSFLAFQHNKSK